MTTPKRIDFNQSTVITLQRNAASVGITSLAAHWIGVELRPATDERGEIARIKYRMTTHDSVKHFYTGSSDDLPRFCIIIDGLHGIAVPSCPSVERAAVDGYAAIISAELAERFDVLFDWRRQGVTV